MGREHGSLLPAVQITHVLAGEENAAVVITLQEDGVVLTPRAAPAHPCPEGKPDVRPGDAHAVAEDGPIVRVQVLDIVEGVCDPFLRGFVGERFAGGLVPDVTADEDTFSLMEPRAGIPDLCDVSAGPGNPAIDLMVELPKSLLGLERDLTGGHVTDRGNTRFDLLGEVRLDVSENREWNRANEIVRIDLRSLPGCPGLPADLRSLRLVFDCRYLRIVLDHRGELSAERLSDAAHPPDGLQHRRGLLHRVD